MLKKSLLILCVLFAAILIGCNKTETGNSNTTTENSNKAATTTASTPATSTTTASAGDKIGVPECDDFIAKYEACVAKAPEVARAQFQSAVKQWRDSWKKMADNPATKGSLAAACKAAKEQQEASPALKSFGCTW